MIVVLVVPFPGVRRHVVGDFEFAMLRESAYFVDELNGIILSQQRMRFSEEVVLKAGIVPSKAVTGNFDVVQPSDSDRVSSTINDLEELRQSHIEPRIGHEDVADNDVVRVGRDMIELSHKEPREEKDERCYRI